MSNRGARAAQTTPTLLWKTSGKLWCRIAELARKQDPFGFMAGEIKIVGDIESVVVRLEQWQAIPTSHA